MTRQVREGYKKGNNSIFQPFSASKQEILYPTLGQLLLNYEEGLEQAKLGNILKGHVDGEKEGIFQKVKEIHDDIIQGIKTHSREM